LPQLPRLPARLFQRFSFPNFSFFLIAPSLQMVSWPVRLGAGHRAPPAIQTLQRPAQILHPEIPRLTNAASINAGWLAANRNAIPAWRFCGTSLILSS